MPHLPTITHNVIFKINFLFNSVHLCASVHVCLYVSAGAFKGQKKMWHSLELAFQMVMNSKHGWLGSQQEQQTLLTTEPSFWLPVMFFNYVVSPSLPYLKPLFLCLHPLFMGSHTIWYLGKTLVKKHTNVSPCPISKCKLVWLTLKYIAMMKQLTPR